MTRPRTRGSKEIFLLCSEVPPTERDVILDRECGDDRDLRGEVESLLKSSQSVPEGFLTPPAEVAKAADQARASGAGEDGGSPHAGSSVAPQEKAGQVIDRYELISQVGEGGFGVVWEAEQREPIRRRVALKLIKLGMDTKQVIARFEAERQVLAMMDHPNIATVLDAGTTSQGRPYFVMELVRGTPILDYCEERGLDTVSRLELFMKVCRAIHHAHQKGIIHRDIKPTNVLITLNDEEAVPKVIDFGIAKATDPEQVRKTQLTLQRQLMGTPAYMSPEQVELGGIDVDTRSDIYSLGVLLYELLTGTTPFDSETLTQAGIAEVVRIIREEEPQRPSARVASLAGSVSRGSGHDAARASARARRLEGDLDWIAMKCLEKDRSRRYETANDLADDVRRHLDDAPVSAGPPSLGYRCRKLFRRHRVSILLGGTAAAALLAFLTGGFAWTAWKNRELDASNALLDKRNMELLRQKTRAQLALADVERLSDARVLDDLEARSRHELWPALPAKVEPMRLWLEDAQALIDRSDRHREKLSSLRSAPERLDTPKDAWLNDLLSDLVQRLDAFNHPETGTLASVRRRLSFASTVQRRTVDEFAEDWRDTIAGIRGSERYPRLRQTDLEPQVGLIPLGPDPESGLYEFLHLATHAGPIPERNDTGRLPLSGATGVILVLLPGGRTELGAQKDDPDAPGYDPDARIREAPVRTVTLDPFFIAKYEMTQGQWSRIENGANPSFYKAGISFEGRAVNLLHPVESAPWADCDRVTRKVDLQLPSDDQWEYAARAGTRTIWPSGATPESLRGFANLGKGTLRLASESGPSVAHDDGFRVHAPVGRFRANTFGLHDVCGNVTEWCNDRVEMKFKSARSDVRHVLAGRAARGGGYSSRPVGARSAARTLKLPNEARSTTGLRPARALR